MKRGGKMDNGYEARVKLSPKGRWKDCWIVEGEFSMFITISKSKRITDFVEQSHIIYCVMYEAIQSGQVQIQVKLV